MPRSSFHRDYSGIIKQALFVAFLLVIVTGLAACAPTRSPRPTASPTPTATVTDTPTVRPTKITTETSVPTVTPSAPAMEDPTLLLPESAESLHRASADLDADGAAEEIVLTGWGGAPQRLGHDFLQMFVISSDDTGEGVIAWQSEQLPTDRAEPLEVRDVNGDGFPEVLSVQAMGASGEMLYILAWQDDGYGWLSPHGGHFDEQEAFGETGVRLEDVDGDGLVEILASYGPAARYIDVYGWDGEAYVYQETLNGVEAG